MTNYARAYRGRTDHIVSGSSTRCGLPLTGMATWPASVGNRAAVRRTCDACRDAAKES